MAVPAKTGLGVSGPIVYAPTANQAAYPYRAGLGRIPGAEFVVFFDDFLGVVTTNIPWGWKGAVIDTSATATKSTTAGSVGASGVLKLIGNSTNTLEGVSCYMEKDIQLTVGKKFFMEVRVQTDDVTDNNVQFGLTDLTATTNPEDLYNTTAANLISLGILDGAATVGMLSDAGNSGTVVQAGTRSMVASTWHTLAISYDGANVYGWVDGYQTVKWSGAASTVPTGVALAPFISMVNGDGAGGSLVYFDYVRVHLER